MGQADIPLNDRGVAQAERLARMLAHKNIDLVITSDLSRARQTAEIIVRATNAELVIDKDLRERHLGITQGMQREDRDRMYGDSLYEYETKVPGGESFKEMEERVMSVFRRHKKSHRHKNVVLVLHGGPIRMIVKNLKSLPLEHIIKKDAVQLGNGEAMELAILPEKCKTCGSDIYEQDPDVFDTWFSSGQWPYATLKTGRKTDFAEFYPTDVMAPGYEILFFWVARMVMLGLYRTGAVPFRTVYLHGIVRDKDRKKMSKSKGNIVDPLGIIELYGTDALRMALVVGTAAGGDPTISEEKIRGYRNFATKIWNISRFLLLHRPGKIPPGWLRPTAEDKTRLKELADVKRRVTAHIEKFEFHLAAETLYHYLWHTFADKIIEAAKPRLGKDASPSERVTAYATLQEIFLESLKMLHPFMPFVTEEIYQKFLPAEAKAKEGKPGRLLMIEQM
jgi:valyl-tRNA synthetase